MAYGDPKPPKRKRTNPADQMAARTQSQVMDVSGTGDPMMDATISGEIKRKTAMKAMMSPASQGVQKAESTLSRFKRMLGIK